MSLITDRKANPGGGAKPGYRSSTSVKGTSQTALSRTGGANPGGALAKPGGGPPKPAVVLHERKPREHYDLDTNGEGRRSPVVERAFVEVQTCHPYLCLQGQLSLALE